MNNLDLLLNQLAASPAAMSAAKIGLFFVLAWLVHRLRHLLARLMVHINDSPRAWRLPPQLNRLAQATAHPDTIPPHRVKADRETTLRELVANGISWLAFTSAAIAGLHQFANTNTIVWVFGLFGTAIGFAARTFIGDLLAGLSIIFQDRFAVGEKIAVKAQLEMFEGVVEHVTLSATWLRAATGELYIIQNGEMRFICNFSRGLHSSANISLKINSTDLDRALPLLKKLGEEAVSLLPHLKEPWQIISETGAVGEHTELTLLVKTHFGQAADLRPQLLRLVQKRLSLADIPLVG